jgi:hypothetical protein
MFVEMFLFNDAGCSNQYYFILNGGR